MTEEIPVQPAEEGERDAAERLEREKETLLSRVASSELETLTQKVAWLLNHFPRTRNSDIALQIEYWKTFQSRLLSGNAVELQNLYTLTRLTSIARARAKIQNEYKLFLADPEVREQRGTLEEDEREKALESTDFPVYAVFLDESGKTSSQLIVGSLWFLSSGSESIVIQSAAMDLKKRRDFKEEFHFSQLRRDDVETYKQLIDIIVDKGGTVSFKFISVERHGIKNIQAALEGLYYNLLVRGIDHEVSTGRAPLPRILNVWKDKEGEGADRLLMANLENQLKQAAASIYSNKLVVEKCIAVDSHNNIFIQVADLIASSINRILSRDGQNLNHKDEFADYLVHRLGIRADSELDIPVGDVTAHIRL